jgi:hypothetical protein
MRPPDTYAMTRWAAAWIAPATLTCGCPWRVRRWSLVVDRLPGLAAYPRQSGPGRLFVLLPRQIGRYQANFRFTSTTCACNPSWYYEDWLILVANGQVRSDGFISRKPDHDVDQRVHLYGGPRRPSRR